MNAKWLNANTKKCPKCRANIEKTYGCNWMTCHSCKHGFCWLCMGDEAAHPGRAGNHARQCDNIEQVRAKGREQFMVENNMDNNDVDALYQIIKKFEVNRKNIDSAKRKKDEAYDIIKDMVELNDEYNIDDFENLFYC